MPIKHKNKHKTFYMSDVTESNIVDYPIHEWMAAKTIGKFKKLQTSFEEVCSNHFVPCFM